MEAAPSGAAKCTGIVLGPERCIQIEAIQRCREDPPLEARGIAKVAQSIISSVQRGHRLAHSFYGEPD